MQNVDNIGKEEVIKKDLRLGNTQNQLFNEFSQYYHIINKFKESSTLQDLEIIKTELSLSSTDQLLDLGCGYGRVTNPLLLDGFNVLGLDFTKHLINEARIRNGFNDNFILGDFFLLDKLFKNKSFDKVFSIYSSIGHGSRDDDFSFFKGVNRVLKPGGLLLLEYRNFLLSLQYQNINTSFINDINDEYKVLVNIKLDLQNGKILVREELLDLKMQSIVHKGNFTLNLYTHFDLIELGKKAGFELVKIRGRESDSEVYWYEPEVFFIYRKVNDV